MVAAHVVAVLLTGLVLAHGATMLRSLCAAGLRLVSALRMVQRRPLRVWSRPRRPGGPVDGVFVRRRGLVLATRRGRRGLPCPAW